MNKYTYRELDTAHRDSNNNAHLASVAKDCACFRCLEHFTATEIEWIESKSSRFAICPKCGIDAVLIEDKLDRVPDDFLKEMQAEYFGSVASEDLDVDCEQTVGPNAEVSGFDSMVSFESLFEDYEKTRAIRLFEADLILADRAEKAKK